MVNFSLTCIVLSKRLTFRLSVLVIHGISAVMNTSGKAQIVEGLDSLSIPIDSVRLNPANTRRHSPAGIDLLKASLAKYGQRKPIVVQKEGMIVRAGNGCLIAARELGWEKIAAVVIDETNIDAVAYEICDNRSAEVGSEWEWETLAQQLDVIANDGLDLDLTGFSAADLNEMINDLCPSIDPDECDEPEAPEDPIEPIVRHGDLWLLGHNRVLCGDCTSSDDVARVMSGDNPRTIITSPPYYNARDYAHWDSVDVYISDMISVVAIIAKKCEHLCVVWNIGDQSVHRLDLSSMTSVAMNGVCGIEFRDKIAWIKPGAAFDVPRNAHISKGLYYPAFSWEPILIFTKGNHPRIDKCFIPELQEECTDTWHIGTVRSQNEKSGHHCAAFPLSLAVKAMKCYTEHGCIVYDPFLGSGTTLIAADEMGRHCYGMEIQPIYVQSIIERWQKQTGKEAILDGSNKTFAEISEERIS